MIKRLKKPYKRLLFAIIVFLIVFFFVFLFLNIYNNYRIKHALIHIELKNDLNVEVYSKIKINDLITKINGELIEDKEINTTRLGKQQIQFEYINEENLTIPYTIEIKVVDKTPPIISQYNTKEVYVGDKNFKKTLFCGDNYDNKPKCIIKGEYDINTPGTYLLTFTGIDSSNNISSHNFNLIVKEKPKSSKSSTNTNNNSNVFNNSVSFSKIKKEYKTKNTKIGIDVSKWQGDINYKQVKKSGVEFAIIKLGGRDGKDGELYLDDYYKENIKGFNKVNIPVGVYFYSHAKNKEEALEEAKFVIKNIKKYDVSLPIAFDWENFETYRSYNLSFYNLTEVAKTFMNYIESKDYKAMLYGSKYTLENYWYETDYKTWLAHYTDKTNYEGKYYLWQMTDKGKVKGINDNVVDIDIMYNKKN